MERSRSKRGYYYPDHDPEPTPARTKPRYSAQHAYTSTSARTRTANGYRGPKPTTSAQDHSAHVTTSYRILCHDAKVGGVIGKGGGIIKQIRQHTGAWVNVHELVAGDDERIIEISDARRRDADGRMPAYSPAESGLLLVHDRILNSEPQGIDGVEDGEYGRNGGLSNRVATRIVVSRMHVGCLLGKGGKIIEQMRVDTKTQIRVLPRDHTLPRCISTSEEIVQIVGEVNNVKSAVEIIAARLKESQHRDRSNFNNRAHSPDSFPDEDYVPRRVTDAASFAPRLSSSSYGSNSFTSRQSEGVNANPEFSDGVLYGKDLVFRMLCPADRVHRVIGEGSGIVELLQNEIGVDVKLAEELIESTNERIIIVSSEESADDELFPAQEGLLHIQTRIADLASDQDDIVRTRLLITSGETRCLQGIEDLLEMERATGAKLQLIHEKVSDEILEIEGEIKSARDALVEVTSRLRSFQLAETSGQEDNPVPAFPTEADPTRKREGGNRIAVPIVTRILEVVIPEHAAPKLITKSRNNLTQISELSGAIVTLVEERAGTDKVIQISGTPEQAERAQSLLQGFILSTLDDVA